MTLSTETDPQYHIKLSDGSTTLGMILYNQRNERDHTVLKRFEIEGPLRFSAVESEYASLDFPYARVVQKDFSGGLGHQDFGKDDRRYWDAGGINTGQEGKFYLGPRMYYSNAPWRTQINGWGDYDKTGATSYDYSGKSLYGASQYHARKFTVPTGGGFYCYWTEFIASVTGSPGDLKVAIYSDSPGSPNAQLAISAALSPSSYTDGVYNHIRLSLGYDSLVASTTYWIVFIPQSAGDASNHWTILGDVATDGTAQKRSSDLSAWSNDTARPFFRLIDNTDDMHVIFCEYQKALFVGSHPIDGSAGDLYINGYRGAATDNTGNLDTLRDTEATPFAGIVGKSCVVRMVEGRETYKNPTWREGSGYSSSVIDVSPDWNFIHDPLYDSYSVVGTDHWSVALTDSGKITGPITDLLEWGPFLYIAQQKGYLVQHWQHLTTGDVWEQAAFEDLRIMGEILTARVDPVYGPMLYIGRQYISGASGGDYEARVRFSTIPVSFGEEVFDHVILEEVQDAWDEQVVSGVTTTYEKDEPGTKVAVGAAFTTGIIASEAIVGDCNLLFTEAIDIQLKSSIDLNAGDLQFLVDDSANCASPLLTLEIPSLKANVTEWVTLFYRDTDEPALYDVNSIGLQVAVEKVDTAFDVYVKRYIEAFKGRESIVVSYSGDRITGMTLYDDPEMVYVFTEGGFGYIDHEQFIPAKLKELRTVSSEENGAAHCVSDVYLVFSMAGTRVQRYFRQNLEDISPIRDDGLPTNRLGRIAALRSYPGGRIIMAIDGGTNNYSSILMFDGVGWNTLYTSPFVGEPITALHIQPIPGQDHVDRLWFNMGADLCWLPLSLNPLTDNDYRFTHYGYIVTSWYDLGIKDLEKVWEKVTVYFDEDESAYGSCYVDYQLDNDTTWTEAGSINVALGGSRTLSSGYSQVKGIRIRFRFRLGHLYDDSTPIINSIVIDAYRLGKPKYGYVFTTKLTESDLSIDLEGDEVSTMDVYSNVQLALAKIDEWAENLTRLTMESVYSPADSLYGWINLVPFQPLTLIPDDQIEEHFLQIQFNEFD